MAVSIMIDAYSRDVERMGPVWLVKFQGRCIVIPVSECTLHMECEKLEVPAAYLLKGRQ